MKWQTLLKKEKGSNIKLPKLYASKIQWKGMPISIMQRISNTTQYKPKIEEDHSLEVS